mgnify:CR=1 FL=1
MPPAVIAVLVVAGVVAWTVFLVFVLSRLTGWATLARHYATDAEPAGERLTWEGARLKSWGFYNSCLVVILSERGLYLATFRPFRIGHRPLLIPWSNVHHVRDGTILGQEGSFLEVDAGSRRIALLLDRDTWHKGARFREAAGAG